MIRTAPIETQANSRDEATGLTAVMNLFDTFNRHGLRYCHWKSNLRLTAALSGQTDLDLLVDPRQRQQLRQILRDHDVISILAVPGSRYPGLEDYLGFDPESGKQFHLHVHFQLVLGEQFVKNYHIPLEVPLLDKVRRHHGIKVPSPELELIILSMRALLKYRDRDVIKDLLTIRTPGIPAHILEEIDWLLTQTSIATVAQALDEIGEAVPAGIVLAFLNTVTVAPRNGRTLYRLRRRLRKALQPYQRYDRFTATLIYFRELWRRRKTFLRFAAKPQMTLAGGGMTLALVGIDGAGKSTLSQAVADWLDWKLEVHAYYLGSKQPSRMSDWSYLFFRMGRRSHRALSRRIGEGNFVTRMVKPLRDSLLHSHYLFTGYDRFRRFLGGRREANEGAVVIYDRYPLEAPLDGPQIHLVAGSNGSWSSSVFTGLEQRLYRQMHLPDLLIVLEVSPDVSLRRKPDHQWEAIVEKNEVLGRLTTAMEANGAQLVRIDAGQPLEDVLRGLKKEIWQRLGT